jgi:hypothetical protein
MKLGAVTQGIRHLFVASIGIVALVGSGAKAQMYQYVLDGGTATLTGSIGSTTFTNAKWSVTSVADFATAVTDSGVTVASATSQLQVFSGSSTYTYDLTAPTGSTTKLGFVDFGGFGYITFAPLSDDNSVTGAAPSALGLYSLSSLQTPGSYIAFITGLDLGSSPDFITTAGTLTISSDSDGFGSLTVSNYSPSAVPEPAEWAGLAMLGSGLGGLVVRARRRKVTA